jgi:hypothetical protein
MSCWPVRVNISATYGVVDPVLAVTAASDFAEALHRALQLAFRRTVGQRTEGLKIVDRAFQRYDVVLESLPETPEAADRLITLTAMPADLVDRVRASLPIVVVERVGADEMLAALTSLAEVGAEAVSELTTFRRFDLELDATTTATDPAVAEALRIMGLAATETDGGPVVELRGSRLAAEWAAAVLDSAGASTELVLV